MATGLSLSSYIAQVVAGQPRKPSPIHDALQAIQNWAASGLTDGDIAAAAGIAISKTALSTYTPPTDWTPGFTGFSVAPTFTQAKYVVIGKLCTVWYRNNAAGTSNANTFTITGFPVALKSGMTDMKFNIPGGVNNGSGVAETAVGYLNGTTLTLSINNSGGAWVAANAKYIESFCITYPID